MTATPCPRCQTRGASYFAGRGCDCSGGFLVPRPMAKPTGIKLPAYFGGSLNGNQETEPETVEQERRTR